MENVFAVFRLAGPDLGKLIGVWVALSLSGYVLYLLYRACGMDSPVAIRLAHTITALIFLVLFFTVLPGCGQFRALNQPPGRNDAIVVLLLYLVWLIVLWTKRPIPEHPHVVQPQQ